METGINMGSSVFDGVIELQIIPECIIPLDFRLYELKNVLLETSPVTFNVDDTVPFKTILLIWKEFSLKLTHFNS